MERKIKFVPAYDNRDQKGAGAHCAEMYMAVVEKGMATVLTIFTGWMMDEEERVITPRGTHLAHCFVAEKPVEGTHNCCMLGVECDQEVMPYSASDYLFRVLVERGETDFWAELERVHFNYFEIGARSGS